MDKLAAYLNVKQVRIPQWISQDDFVFSYSLSGVPQVWKGNIHQNDVQQLSHYEDFITEILADAHTNRWVFSMAEGGNERSQIYYSVDGNAPVNLTNQPDAVHMLGAFIPNSNLLLFSSNLRDPNHFDLETIDVVTGKREVVLENYDHYNFVESVSPDGRYYMYRKLISQSNQPLWCFDTKTKTTQSISHIEAQYGNSLWLDHDTFYYLSNAHAETMFLAKYEVSTQTSTKVLSYDWDIESIALSFDQKYLSLILNEEGYLKLIVLDRETLEPITLPEMPLGTVTFYDQVSWSPTKHQLLFSFSSGTEVPNIWYLDIDAQTVSKATPNALEMGSDALVEPTLCRFESFDGLSVPYWLYVPKGKEAKNLPVLIEIHGGPEGQQMASFDDILSYVVSEGIAVVAPNVRGSTGYGKTYTHLDDVEKRLDSVQDIESLVHHLIETGIADPEKIAVSGTSYGGFMTLSCAARYPDLFCAAVDTVGMYNLVTFLERTAGYRRAHRESEYGSLETDRELLYQVSPIAKVDDIKGPLMIIHGTNDPRVPVYEAQNATEYLTNKGVEVQFLEYKDEGHGIHKIENRMDCYPKVINFLHEKMGLKKA